MITPQKHDINILFFSEIAIVFTLFFTHLFSAITYYHGLILSLFLAMFGYAIYNKKLVFNKIDLLWVLCAIDLIISIVYSEHMGVAGKYVFVFCISLFIKILYEQESAWQKLFFKLMIFAAFVHIVATYIQFINPNLVDSFNKQFLNKEDYHYNVEFMKREICAGITGQTGINGYFISIFMAIMYCYLLIGKKKRILSAIFLMIAGVALFLTGKRGLILDNAVAILVIYVLVSRFDKKIRLSYLLVPVVLLAIVVIIYQKMSLSEELLYKIQDFGKNDDITNGRLDIWKDVWEVFTENPIMGIGANNVTELLDEAPHNVFLQLLAENGILGFGVFVFTMIVTTFKSTRHLYRLFKVDAADDAKVYGGICLYIELHFIAYCMTGNPLYGTIFLLTYFMAIAGINSYASSYNVAERKIDENRNSDLSQGIKHRSFFASARSQLLDEDK